ncbi:AarF/ABC1/UbiB kinase family protein [Olsenella sp. HMSC062G07]|uniref:ABC1 kinase family protein n=1 Tax=Olsenella sp. HMSC062G07 TaxID=1739330 RepID=UPI0008A3FFF2|nr:lipopolysaccharide core heptose(II) kinase RfaY [Olsenella sp. HMSC062G07]OFK24106.1 ABC transporter [Olsenella sp. HMSC062G07]
MSDVPAEAAEGRSRSDAGAQGGTHDETIGLLGGGLKGAGRYRISRASKLARLWEILSIASHYDLLRGLTPLTLRQLLEELGPTFVKAGQILSMRSEILPQSFCEELAKLRTSVEPMGRDLLLDTLRAEYDQPLEDIFDAIDDVPLGSASVAQVHKARLASGELVAVKVQRPHVQEIMAQDISIMRSLAARAARVMGEEQFLDLQSVMDELWQSFLEETDFQVEARSLEEFRRNNADCRFVGSPRPIPRYCTEHVVVMEYMEGIPIDDVDALREAGYDLREVGTKLVDNYAQQMLDDGFFHADPHPGNLVVQKGKIIYLDLGIMGRLSSHDRLALQEMVFAVAGHDVARLKEGLLRFSVGELGDVDHPHLLADLDHIMDEFGTADLSELDVAAFINALISMARKDGVELPGSVIMLGRSLVTLEGVANALIPDVSMVEIIRDHIRAHRDPVSQTRDDIRDFAQDALKATRSLVRAVPEASETLRMLTRGQLRMNLDLPGTTDPMSDIAHAADRLTMGIVIAGLFIGSSVIYYARIKPVIFGIPIIGLIGYLVALALGLWIVSQIIAEDRRRRR